MTGAGVDRRTSDRRTSEQRCPQIRCNAVALGLILADDMPSGRSSTSFGRQGLIREDGRSVDVASVVSFLAFDQSKFITGHTILVDGGISVNLAGVTGRDRVGGA